MSRNEVTDQDIELLKEAIPYKTREGHKGMQLAYIDARDAQNRLDVVLSPYNWKVEHHTKDGYVWATVSIFVYGEWIGKTDCSDHKEEYQWNDIEKTKRNGEVYTQSKDTDISKSQFSDSFKRACVMWGLGRFLYDVKPSFSNNSNQQQYTPSSTGSGATEKQIGLIRSLFKQTPMDQEQRQEFVENSVGKVESLGDLTKSQASDLIGVLKEFIESDE